MCNKSIALNMFELIQIKVIFSLHMLKKINLKSEHIIYALLLVYYCVYVQV